MAKFLVTYHGGKPPANAAAADEIKAAFGAWLQQAGAAVTDPGAPVRTATNVSSGSATASVEVGGYSVIEAASLGAAVALLETHPFVARGGTLWVHEAVTI
jgi:hypothetical protein